MYRITIALALALGACTTTQGEQPQQTEEVAPGDGLVWVARAYPTGDRKTSAVLVERGAPAEVLPGESYEYRVRVTNLAGHDLQDVVVTETVPLGFTVTATEPQARGEEGRLIWTVGALAAGQQAGMRVTGSAASTGTLNPRCEVTWRAPLALATEVVLPELSLACTAPAQTLRGDPLTLALEVGNVGSGTARNVVVAGSLPEGLITLEGASTFEIPVGALPAGKTRTVQLPCDTTRTGLFELKVGAKADGGLAADSGILTIKITQPVLEVTVASPTRTFIGSSIGYDVTIRNAGDGQADATVVELTLPAGTRFSAATEGGASTGDRVRWNLGTIPAGESRTVQATFETVMAAEGSVTATVRARAADEISANAVTAIEGIPALALEVSDVSDPVAVGTTATYVVSVRNQGSAPGTQIAILCELEESMEFLGASGATAGSAKEQMVSFDPLAELAPGAEVSWRVEVRATAAGDVRFTARLTSAQLARPVDASEATSFYE